VTPGGLYTVFWNAPPDVFVQDVNLVGVGTGMDKFGRRTNILATAALSTFHGHIAAKHTAVLLTVLK
jgi:hypothetical protein